MAMDRENESVRLPGQPDAQLRLIIDEQVLILQQKLLIHIPGDVRERVRHLGLVHANALSDYQWKESQT